MANIYINKQTRQLFADRLCRNPLSFSSLLPTAGADIPLVLHAVDSDGPTTLSSPAVTIASKDVPVGGTITLSYNGTSLGEIDLLAGQAEWEAYVNANAAIATLGGFDVFAEPGRVVFQSRAVGTFADFAIVAHDFVPFGTAVLTQTAAGDANEREIWVLTMELGTIAVQNSFSQSSTVAATITELVTGSASVAEVQRITLSGEPIRGYWNITTASGITLPLKWDVGPRHIEAAMNTKLGAGTVVVSQSAAFSWDIAWTAVGAQSALTATVTGLTGLQASTGTLSLDTNEAEALPSAAVCQVQITDGTEVLYTETVPIGNLNLVGDTPVTQTAGVVRYDTAQTLTSDQQTQARTNISAAKSGAVTGSGLTMATARLLGRTTASTGAIEEISIGSGLTLSAGSLSSSVDLSGYLPLAGGTMTGRLRVGGAATAPDYFDIDSNPTQGTLTLNRNTLGSTESCQLSPILIRLFGSVDSAGLELSRGSMEIVNLSGFGALLKSTNLSADRTIEFPDQAGTVMVGANNLSDVSSASTARTNLGLSALATTTPGTGVATFLATPSSANLAAALTDETGTGAAVFATSPTLVTPILGTPTSGTLTNCTIPASGISTGIISDDRLYPLRPSSFAGAYDDDFTGSSLDAKWSRQGLVSGDHTYQTGNGSWMSMSIAAGTTGALARSIYQTWTPADSTITCRLIYQQIGSAYPMMGPFIVDSSGNGVGVTLYNNANSFCIATLASWVFSSFALYVTMGLPDHNIATGATGIWFKLRKSSTTYYASVSYDGIFWSPEVSAVNATTMSRVGMGTFFRAGGSSDYGAMQHFDFFKIT